MIKSKALILLLTICCAYSDDTDTTLGKSPKTSGRQKRLLFYDEDGSLVKTFTNPYLQDFALRADRMPFYGNFINPFFAFIRASYGGSSSAFTIPVSNEIIEKIQSDPGYEFRLAVVPKKEPVITPSALCNGKRTQIPAPLRCNNFLNCWDGWSFEQECPDDLLFSREGYCDYSYNVDCTNREILIKPMAPIPVQPQPIIPIQPQVPPQSQPSLPSPQPQLPNISQPQLPSIPQPELPSVPQPQLPSISQPQLPSMPQPQLPSVPQPQLPSVPQFPSIPQPELPSVPQPQLPSMPQPQLPGVPQPQLPSVPQFPSIPQPELPSVPQPQLPSLPQPQLPSMPQPQLPSIPQPELPSVPQFPSIPQPQLPSIPQPQLPSTPQPQLPSVPQPQLPTISQPQIPCLTQTSPTLQPILFEPKPQLPQPQLIPDQSPQSQQQPAYLSKCTGQYKTYRSPHNCKEFYICVDGKLDKYVCTGDLVFSEDAGLCFPRGIVDCGSTPIDNSPTKLYNLNDNYKLDYIKIN